jgi:hypothetical protein
MDAITLSWAWAFIVGVLMMTTIRKQSRFAAERCVHSGIASRHLSRLERGFQVLLTALTLWWLYFTGSHLFMLMRSR